jgi:thiopurine S-methyltransferase
MWQADTLGWHKTEVGFALREHGDVLGEGGRGLVPLCGKSIDLPFLAAQGREVVGVEFVRQAVDDFFSEQALTPEVTETDAGTRHVSGDITIHNGDFFAVTDQALGRFQWIYDRAALVAIDPQRRSEYAGKLLRLLDPSGRMLLVTLSYPQGTVSGPPWSVTPEDLQRLYGDAFAIAELTTNQRSEIPPSFSEAGLDHITERVWSLRRR